MTRLLVLVPNMSAARRRQLHDRLGGAFPELSITSLGSFAEADPYIGSTDILMAYNVPDALAAKAGNVKWIQSLASGTDGFLSRPSLPKTPMITRMQNVAAPPVSEGIIAFLFALSRQLPAMLRAQDRRQWDRDPSEQASLIAGKTAGILGVGQIAEALAPKLKALGMTVVGFSSRTDVAGFDRIRPHAELVAGAGDLDCLIVLVPLRPETRNIVDARVLGAMKPSAFLINVSRGALVDEAALIEALSAGKIAGAGLDTFATEPLPVDSPLWSLPNVIVTPHATASHVTYIDDIFPLLETNMRRYLAGDLATMMNVVRRGAGGPGGQDG